MKVLHVVSGMDPREGGVTTAVCNMLAGLTQYGVVQEVACLDASNELFIKSDPRIHGLGPSVSGWRYSKQLMPWLAANIANFDAVIVHGLWQYHVYAVYKAWRVQAKKPKLFVMPHGMLDPYFQRAKSRRLKAIRNNIFWRFVESRLINVADCLFFTCETEQILATQTFKNYHPKETAVVGLGINEAPEIDKSSFEKFKAEFGLADVENPLLFISRIHPKKGIDLLIEAYCALEKEKVNLPKLIVAGPGLDTDFGNAIKERSVTSDNIIFTGMLRGQNKWAAYHLSAAMILPSHQENFGFVVAESLACGKPVLITNQVNIWREIEHHKAGITKDDTVDGIRKLLLEWVNMPDLVRKDMTRNALLCFSEHFSLSAASSTLFKTLQRFCQR